MILTLLLFADGVRSVATPFGTVELISPQVAVERAMRCGVGPVTVRHDDVLQEDMLVIAATAEISEDQIICIDKAAGYYEVELPTAAQPRFMATRVARLNAEAKVAARQWLGERKLLDRLPAYQPGVTDDAGFARAIEDLCGPRAKGALQSEYGPHALSPEWMAKQSPTGPGDAPMICLMNAAAASDYAFGFIGNERNGDSAE